MSERWSINRVNARREVSANRKLTVGRNKQRSPTGEQHALLSQDSRLAHSTQISPQPSYTWRVILSRPKAVVVRLVRAESICGGGASEDSHWLTKAIHSKAARK